MSDRALSLSEYYIPSKGSETKIRASKSALSSEQSHGPEYNSLRKKKHLNRNSCSTEIIFHFDNLASLEFTLVLAVWWTSRLRAGMATRSGELVVPNTMELAPVRLRTGWSSWLHGWSSSWSSERPAGSPSPRTRVEIPRPVDGIWSP